MNLHPSLLPEYKGCFSCPWTIINGERKTGITFHEITEGIDSGNILQQHEVGILDNETGLVFIISLLRVSLILLILSI